MATLTKDQQDNYWRDGFVLIEDAVPADVLKNLQNVTRNFIDQSRAVTNNNDIYDLDNGHSKQTPRLNRIKTPHAIHHAYRDYLCSDALLSLIQPLLGANIRMNNSKLNTKAAQGGAPVESGIRIGLSTHTPMIIC